MLKIGFIGNQVGLKVGEALVVVELHVGQVRAGEFAGGKEAPFGVDALKSGSGGVALTALAHSQVRAARRRSLTQVLVELAPNRGTRPRSAHVGQVRTRGSRTRRTYRPARAAYARELLGSPWLLRERHGPRRGDVDHCSERHPPHHALAVRDHASSISSVPTSASLITACIIAQQVWVGRIPVGFRRRVGARPLRCDQRDRGVTDGTPPRDRRSWRSWQSFALAGCWLQPGFDPQQSGYNFVEQGNTPGERVPAPCRVDTAARRPGQRTDRQRHGVYATAGGFPSRGP